MGFSAPASGRDSGIVQGCEIASARGQAGWTSLGIMVAVSRNGLRHTTCEDWLAANYAMGFFEITQARRKNIEKFLPKSAFEIRKHYISFHQK